MTASVVILGYPSGLAGPTDTQDRGRNLRKPSPLPPELDYCTPTTQSNFALSGSGVPCSGVGTPAVAAAAGEGPSPIAQQLHSLQPHATVRDLTHVGLRRIPKRRGKRARRPPLHCRVWCTFSFCTTDTGSNKFDFY